MVTVKVLLAPMVMVLADEEAVRAFRVVAVTLAPVRSSVLTLVLAAAAPKKIVLTPVLSLLRVIWAPTTTACVESLTSP